MAFNHHQPLTINNEQFKSLRKNLSFQSLKNQKQNWHYKAERSSSLPIHDKRQKTPKFFVGVTTIFPKNFYLLKLFNTRLALPVGCTCIRLIRYHYEIYLAFPYLLSTLRILQTYRKREDTKAQPVFNIVLPPDQLLWGASWFRMRVAALQAFQGKSKVTATSVDLSRKYLPYFESPTVKLQDLHAPMEVLTFLFVRPALTQHVW